MKLEDSNSRPRGNTLDSEFLSNDDSSLLSNSNSSAIRVGSHVGGRDTAI